MVSLSILMTWSLAERKYFLTFFFFHFNEGKLIRSFPGLSFCYFQEATAVPAVIWFLCYGSPAWHRGRGGRILKPSVTTHPEFGQWMRVEDPCNPGSQPRSSLQWAGLPTWYNSVRIAKIIPHRYAQRPFSHMILDSVQFSIGANLYDTQVSHMFLGYLLIQWSPPS